jgi:hypothetical protein
VKVSLLLLGLAKPATALPWLSPCSPTTTHHPPATMHHFPTSLFPPQQEEAVSAISRAIRRARVGLKNPNRPIASFIFAGPTGVGKSELAKTLANYYFGSEEAMVGVWGGLASVCRLWGC